MSRTGLALALGALLAVPALAGEVKLEIRPDGTS